MYYKVKVEVPTIKKRGVNGGNTEMEAFQQYLSELHRTLDNNRRDLRVDFSEEDVARTLEYLLRNL